MQLEQRIGWEFLEAETLRFRKGKGNNVKIRGNTFPGRRKEKRKKKKKKSLGGGRKTDKNLRMKCIKKVHAICQKESSPPASNATPE